MKILIDTIKAARRVSTPLLAISTADQWATMEMLTEGINGKTPKVAWDAARGLRGLNDTGTAAVARLGDPPVIKAQSSNPAAALDMATKLPPETMLFFCNAYRFVNSPVVAQAISNLRDIFKQDGRTLLLMSPSFDLPAELQQDVVLLSEAMPDEETLKKILLGVYESAEQKPQSDEIIKAAVDAARGLAAFASEQVFAMAMRPDGIDLDDAWERKRSAVNQTKGLSITRDGMTFDQLGGLESARKFGDRIFAGGKPPRVIVRIDEIEKMLAGASGPVGDTSGVSQDALGALLRAMEDQGWDGMILVGPPGAAKTMYSRALGASHKVPTLDVDLGAMKGSLVGQSEQAIREGLRVIEGIGGDRVFIVATCNRLDSLPPELKRRFKSGVWMFDLPTKDERTAIWKLYLKKYGMLAKGGDGVEIPDDTNWTGAEIRNCCDLAFRLACTLQEAAAYIVPVATQDPDGLTRLRQTANGRFLSASYPGTYRLDGPPTTEKKPGRSMSKER